jgi:hypothetical protein
MQVLAGYPQHVFYTAIAAVLYVVFCGERMEQRMRAGACVLAFYAGGAALSAVQILTGLAAARESVRGGGVPYEFAAMFSFPPENFLTLLAPGFFGNMADCPYWGRAQLWEMSLFMGVAGFALALFGMTAGSRSLRRGLLPAIAVLYVLALGSHTPLFQLLYNYVPGFNSFRSNSKFIFQAAVLLSLLSGIGFEQLLKSAGAPRTPDTRRMVFALGLTGGVMVSAGLWIQAAVAAGTSGPWGALMVRMAALGETFVIAPEGYRDPMLVSEAGAFAANSLFWCAGILVPVALLFS